MIDLLIALLILLIVFGLIWWAITQIPLPHPFGVIAQVLLVVILLLILLRYVLPLAHVPLR